MRFRAVVAGRFACDQLDRSLAIDLHASAPRALEPPDGDHEYAVPGFPVDPLDHGQPPVPASFVPLAEFLKRA